MYHRFFIFLTGFFLTTVFLFGASSPTGSIIGQLIDAETHSPLVGANVMIANTVFGAATDMEGNFLIPNIPVGNYTVKFLYIGYKPLLKTDVIVKSGRTVQVNTVMQLDAVETEAVSVTAGYFEESEESPSSVNFSYEEIRRAPGSAGDVSRILMSLPSIAKVNDQSNQLIVRGGNPMENAFFMDNIEVPNINHFPDMGTTSGPISMLNVDFIDHVDFYTGGFSAAYGDKISGVMDLSMREGNRDFHSQFDFNMIGIGGVAEGPLGGKGSWLLSTRRSYLDLVVDMFDVGTSVAPNYGDAQWKLVWDLNPAQKLMFLGLYGEDHNAPDREAGQENQMSHYGNQDLYQLTTGLNLRSLWGKRGYSNTSVSWTLEKFDEDFYETNTGIHDLKNHADKQTFSFRNVNHMKLGKLNGIDFGVDGKLITAEYDNFYAQTTGAFGDTIPGLAITGNRDSGKGGFFTSLTLYPHHRFETQWGVRTDYFSMTDQWTFSPRLSLRFLWTDRTSLKASTGIFYQTLPMLLLAQNASYENLRNPRAVHYILGIEHLLSENTRLTCEIYLKEYDRFPLDQNDPGRFPIDDGFLSNFGELNDQGKAQSKGIEVMVQKKLADKVYGLASATWFRSRYKDGNGVWRNRAYDNRMIFSVEGGYKPNHKWEFSTRWIIAGGAPYTPLDVDASALVHREVYDETQINGDRYPAYHSMNVRLDRRFNFSESNLIVYLSAWNVYNHKNIASYYWNDKEKKQDTLYQWLLLPIVGVEWEL